MTTETELQRKVTKYLKSKGCLAYKFASPSNRGVPDLLVIPPSGDVFFIELKHPAGTGTLSKLQQERIAEIRDHEVLVLVTHDYAFLCDWVDKYLAIFKLRSAAANDDNDDDA